MSKISTSSFEETLGVTASTFQHAVLTNTIEGLRRLGDDERRFHITMQSIQGVQTGPDLMDVNHRDMIIVARVLEYYAEGPAVNAALVLTGKGIMGDSNDDDLLKVIHEAVQLAGASNDDVSLGEVISHDNGSFEVVTMEDEA